MASTVVMSWWHEGDATDAAQTLGAEDSCGDAAPGCIARCSGQTPRTSSIFQRFWVRVNMTTNRGAGNAADDQGADRVHQVGAGADGHQTGQRPLCTKPGRSCRHQRHQGAAADHGHQRVQATRPEILSSVWALIDVEAEPADGQDPGAERQEGNRLEAGGRSDAAILG